MDIHFEIELFKSLKQMRLFNLSFLAALAALYLTLVSE